MPQPSLDGIGCAEHCDLAFETAARSIILVHDETNAGHAVGQKLMLGFVGTEPSSDILTMIQDQYIGGVTLFRAMNVVNPAQVRALTDALQHAAVASGHPPLFIAADQEGGQLIAIGGTTPFPGNMALGATGSVDLARKTGYALGLELAAMGVNVNYAPVCDVNTNPRNPVVASAPLARIRP